MGVAVRPYVVAINHVEGCARRKCGPECKRTVDGWEVDVVAYRANGEMVRDRKKVSGSKTAAWRWGEERQSFLLLHGKTKPVEVPTFRAFWPRYLGACKAKRLKPSTMVQKELIYAHDLEPLLGDVRLNDISDRRISKLLEANAEKNAKTVNNILVNVNQPLKLAVKWGEIPKMPCAIELLKVTETEVAFYEPDIYERILEVAKGLDPRVELLVLLGGEAGLRCGEIIALEQGDIDYARNFIHVQKSEWEGHLTTPKSGRSRKIDMTERLRTALKKARHLRGDRVLWRDDGFPKVTQVLLAKWMTRVQKLAGVEVTGGIHILRHTFCSRLAMVGAPALAIKELAGHQSLATTQRYMHLSPKAKESAVRLLEGVRFDQTSGDIMETAQGSVRKP